MAISAKPTSRELKRHLSGKCLSDMSITSSGSSLESRAGLLLPSLAVHTPHDEP